MDGYQYLDEPPWPVCPLVASRLVLLGRPAGWQVGRREEDPAVAEGEEERPEQLVGEVQGQDGDHHRPHPTLFELEVNRQRLLDLGLGEDEVEGEAEGPDAEPDLHDDDDHDGADVPGLLGHVQGVVRLHHHAVQVESPAHDCHHQDKISLGTYM